ncbi:MAG: hypothetical protein V1644_03755 [Candidatus Micrarchaeota archaeon]
MPYEFEKGVLKMVNVIKRERKEKAFTFSHLGVLPFVFLFVIFSTSLVFASGYGVSVYGVGTYGYGYSPPSSSGAPQSSGAPAAVINASANATGEVTTGGTGEEVTGTGEGTGEVETGVGETTNAGEAGTTATSESTTSAPFTLPFGISPLIAVVVLVVIGAIVFFLMRR